VQDLRKDANGRSAPSGRSMSGLVGTTVTSDLRASVAYGRQSVILDDYIG